MYNEQFKINEKSNFPGVYIIVNLDNRKVYVGSTRNILRRLKEHEAKLRKGKHDVKRMQKDYDNGNQFIAYPLTKVQLLDEKYNKDANLRYFEKVAIEKFRSNISENGYNTRVDYAKSPQESNIEWGKRWLDDYFQHKESLKTSTGLKAEYDLEEMESFINDRLTR